MDVGNELPMSLNDVVRMIQESRLAISHASARPPVIASRIFALRSKFNVTCFIFLLFNVMRSL